MNIGIIGCGHVGHTLAPALAHLGHSVLVGTRDPGRPGLEQWARDSGVRLGSYAEAARHGEMVFLCTLWAWTERAIGLADAASFHDKIVVDVTNPVEFSNGTLPELMIGHNTSAGEEVQRWLPGARVVKALNVVAVKFMTDGRLGPDRLDMFIAGNDAGAKASVAGILRAWHWNIHDLGSIEHSRLLEYFAVFSISYGFITGKWDHAFRLVQRTG